MTSPRRTEICSLYSDAEASIKRYERIGLDNLVTMALPGRDALLVAHNIHFDFRMLQNECRKFEYVADPDELSFCDTVALARKLVPGLPHYKLATLIESLGIEMHRRAQLGGDLRRSRTAKRRASGCAKTAITRSTTRWRAARCSSIS